MHGADVVQHVAVAQHDAHDGHQEIQPPHHLHEPAPAHKPPPCLSACTAPQRAQNYATPEEKNFNRMGHQSEALLSSQPPRWVESMASFLLCGILLPALLHILLKLHGTAQLPFPTQRKSTLSTCTFSARRRRLCVGKGVTGMLKQR